MTSDAEEFTFTRIHGLGRRTSFGIGGSVIREDYLAQIGYRGAHLPTPEERRFAAGSFTFDSLHVWHGENPVETPLEGDGFTVKWEQVPPITTMLADGTTLELWTGGGQVGDPLE